jgi:hypothetical protein
MKSLIALLIVGSFSFAAVANDTPTTNPHPTQNTGIVPEEHTTTTTTTTKKTVKKAKAKKTEKKEGEEATTGM